MIEPRQVREVLRSLFGSSLADDPGFAEGAAAVLRSYASYKDSFGSLASRMEDYLFNALYERLGPSMTARMDGGGIRRILTSELPGAADEVMGVFFDSLKVYSVNYDALHTYCMQTGSFSGFRTLLTRFGDLMPLSERRTIARMIRGSYPRERWEAWLKEDDEDFLGRRLRT